MTARQRQGTGSGNAVLSVPAVAETKTERAGAFSWEDWFRHATAQQRAAALGLAHQQGLLYPHQLPAITNGVKPTAAPAKETAVSALLSRLLAGKADALTSPILAPLTFFDTQLDELQQQAVSRALGTPDVFLLQGLPGTGKSRVLAEVILQAAVQGRRVLFLAAHTASLDVVLERLVARPEVFALRFLDAAEKLESLPAWLRGFTLEEQKQAFLERLLSGARGNRDEVESTCRQRREEEPLWADLTACLDQFLAQDERLRQLQEQLPCVAAIVEHDADARESAFAAGLAEMRNACDAAIQALDAARQIHAEALAQCDRETAALAERIAALEPGYLAKKQTRFWTLAFWSNLADSQLVHETEALLAQQTQVQTRRQESAQEIARVETQRADRLSQWNAERAAAVNNEIDARRQALLLDRQALEAQAHRLDEQWHALCRRLNVGPLAKSPEALASAHQAWLRTKQQNEDQCQFAQQWTTFVEETGPQLATRLPSFANVLAGTIPRFHADAKFRDAAATPTDIVLVEDADALTDADLLNLARLARRLILVGAALAEATPPPEKTTRAPLAATAWQRLWSALGGTAGAWPCTWRREDARLVCRLVPLSPDDHRHLESECLADAPDIELGILHRPHTRPSLAQVTFSPHCSFADAFHFMMREVQEFPLEPLGRTGWWSDDAERIVRHFGPRSERSADWFEIEPGVRLEAIDGTRIARMEFAKALGWDRAKAEAWLYRHHPVQDGERTVYLQTPYRYHRALGGLVQSVIRAGDWLSMGAPEALCDPRHVEFVPLPALEKPAWPREGAGLELDLAAARHADRLPTGLRHGLPLRGYVNYLEAQALIRRLETFMQKDVNGHPCRVAVLALYEGQVELLRRLIAQSEILRSGRAPLEVSLPSRLHQRECDVVFLSLTRSHAHRAVAFGADVRELPLALTRARTRLVLFGDPGALCKRIHWQGPLDHLDPHAAHQELLRLSRLAAFLQG